MGRAGPADAVAQQPSRAEWWWPLALLGLALLCVEWLLFHRPTRSRLNRILRRGAAAAR
jgi:hypothetical protein